MSKRADEEWGEMWSREKEMECGVALLTNKLAISNKGEWEWVLEKNTYTQPYMFINEIVNPYKIKKVIFNPPATIVIWEDKTKTVVKCMEDTVFDPDVGLAMCISKKMLGDKFKSTFRKYTKLYTCETI